MNPPRSLNHFVWHDCLTPNIDSALSDFAQLVSWTVLDQTWPNIGRYPIVQSKAGAIAGVLEMPKFLQDSGVPAYWTGYVATNIKAAEPLVPKLGGMMFTMPTTSPMGTSFVFTDPGGAVLAAYELADAFRIPSCSNVGEFVWRRLYSQDNEKSVQFYKALFGWNLSKDGTNRILDQSQVAVADMAGVPTWVDQDSWVYFLGVENLARTISAIESLGGIVLEDTTVQSRHAVVAKDSQDAVIGFVQWE